MSEHPRLVGARVTRTEDPRFLRGQGRYVSNIDRPGALFLRFVRSPYARAAIVGINTEDAQSQPGVVGIFTGEDWGGMVLSAVSSYPGFQSAPMPILASGDVKYVGEPVVAVVASDPYLAEDAADHVVVDYESLKPVVDPDLALDSDSEIVHRGWETNAYVHRSHESSSYAEQVAKADRSVSATLTNARHSGVPLEGRAVIAEYDRAMDDYTVWTGTQIPHLIRTAIAGALGVPEASVRVISPDVGGGFGVKAQAYPEEVACAAAAKAVGGPVKWVEDRREHFVASNHSRQHRHDATLHYSGDGEILALDATVRVDMGAYSVFPWTATMDTGMAMGILPGPYRFSGYRVSGTPIATNKTPYGAYRGVARPAACFTIERLVDWMARDLGLDPLEVRRRNVVRSQDYPWHSAGGLVYDGGSIPESIDALIAQTNYHELKADTAAARARGELRGIGVAVFTEQTAHTTQEFKQRGLPIVFGYETSKVRLDPTGHLTIRASVHNHGQGLETTMAQVAADVLALPLDAISVRFGDTDDVPYGAGTFASRSAVLAGGAVSLGAEDLRQKLARVAAHKLEASPEDIVFESGSVSVSGSPGVGMPIAELCRIIYQRPEQLPDGETPLLESTRTYDAPPGTGTFTNAAHMGMVTVDAATGHVKVDAYWVVEDCGQMINPLVVEGQIHGGVAQGLGSALLEEFVYSPEGQPLTTTFMDYLLPTFCDVPHIETMHLETLSENTIGGIKGMGEGGAIAPAAVVAGAVENALSGIGTVSIDHVPLTPEQVLGYIEQARGGTA